MANPIQLPTKTETAATVMGGGVQMLTIMPQNFGEVMAFAEKMAESNFVPAHLRRKPGDCMAVCLQALRWGMDPFSVAQKTYFTKDGSPPAYEAQLINAVVYARAPLDGRLDIKWEGKWPERICTVTGHIRGDKEPKVRRVNAAGITTRNSPLWKTDPDQQLAYYSTRAWARLFTPDVLMGVYTPDDEDWKAERATDITPAAEPSHASKLDAMEATMAGEAHDETRTYNDTMSTDTTFMLPMTWPDEMADKAEWKTAFDQAKKEIETLPDADACDRWEQANGDGLNILMRLYNVSYQKLGDMLAAKRGQA